MISKPCSAPQHPICKAPFNTSQVSPHVWSDLNIRQRHLTGGTDRHTTGHMVGAGPRAREGRARAGPSTLPCPCPSPITASPASRNIVEARLTCCGGGLAPLLKCGHSRGQRPASERQEGRGQGAVVLEIGGHEGPQPDVCSLKSWRSEVSASFSKKENALMDADLWTPEHVGRACLTNVRECHPPMSSGGWMALCPASTPCSLGNAWAASMSPHPAHRACGDMQASAPLRLAWCLCLSFSRTQKLPFGSEAELVGS